MKLNFRDGDLSLPSGNDEAASFLADIFTHAGKVPDQNITIDWDDMYSKYLSPRLNDATGITTAEIRPLLQTAMEISLREPLMPLMVMTPLFTPIRAKGLTTQVVAGAIGGAVYADDIGEGGTYPENFFQIGGALQTAVIGKSGIQASFTDEALRYSTWDIFMVNLRMMYQALVRHKERKAASFFTALGTRLFDNADPSNSLFGVTHGRGLDMTANGSLVTDDIFTGLAHQQEEGFPVDTMVVNPLMSYQFIMDPLMRNMFSGFGGGAFYGSWNGEVGPRDPWSNGPLGAMGPSTGNRVVPTASPSGETATGIAGREWGMNATFNIPGYLPNGIRVLSSYAVPYDAESGLCDVYLISSGNVGFYLEDEELVRVDWRDESVDMAKVRLRERYGFALQHEGQAVGVMKNINAGTRNFWDGTVRAITQEVFEEIDPSVAVV